MKIIPYHREDPFKLLRDFGSEIEKFFEAPFRNVGEDEKRILAPSLDISEDKSNIYVEADLPGFDQKDVKVKVRRDALVISAEKQEKKEEKKKNYYRCERYQGSFYREAPLPLSVDAEKIKAQYRSGVLKVTLPKKEEEKEKEISVDVE